MCLFLAIHLTIIYTIGRIKFEKKLESSKDIAHLILDKFYSIGIINRSESYKGQKSRKQIMVSSILPKKECWDNFQ